MRPDIGAPKRVKQHGVVSLPMWAIASSCTFGLLADGFLCVQSNWPPATPGIHGEVSRLAIRSAHFLDCRQQTKVGVYESRRKNSPLGAL
jgi:hypothetical protein